MPTEVLSGFPALACSMSREIKMDSLLAIFSFLIRRCFGWIMSLLFIFG